MHVCGNGQGHIIPSGQILITTIVSSVVNFRNVCLTFEFIYIILTFYELCNLLDFADNPIGEF